MYAKHKIIPWQKRNYEQNVILLSWYFYCWWNKCKRLFIFFFKFIHNIQEQRTTTRLMSTLIYFHSVQCQGLLLCLKGRELIFITSSSMLDSPTNFYLDTIWSAIEWRSVEMRTLIYEHFQTKHVELLKEKRL